MSDIWEDPLAIAGAVGSIFAPAGAIAAGLAGGFAGEMLGKQPDAPPPAVSAGKTAAEIEAEKNAKTAADRASYVSASKAKAGRGGLNLTDASRAGAGIALPSAGGPSPYPFVTS